MSAAENRQDFLFSLLPGSWIESTDFDDASQFTDRISFRRSLKLRSLWDAARHGFRPSTATYYRPAKGTFRVGHSQTLLSLKHNHLLASRLQAAEFVVEDSMTWLLLMRNHPTPTVPNTELIPINASGAKARLHSETQLPLHDHLGPKSVNSFSLT